MTFLIEFTVGEWEKELVYFFRRLFSDFWMFWGFSPPEPPKLLLAPLALEV